MVNALVGYCKSVSIRYNGFLKHGSIKGGPHSCMYLLSHTTAVYQCNIDKTLHTGSQVTLCGLL